MQIAFLDAAPSPAIRLIAYLCAADSLPDALEPVLVQAAGAARFGGKTGQIFEGFVTRNGNLARVVLVGIGKADANPAERRENIEKAGAALVARYRTSGEEAVLIRVWRWGPTRPPLCCWAQGCVAGGRMAIAPR